MFSDLKHSPLLCDLPDPWQRQCSGARQSWVDVVTRVNGNQLGHVTRSQGDNRGHVTPIVTSPHVHRPPPPTSQSTPISPA